MTSCTLQGSILELIATHTRASWVIASVNRELSEAVKAARKELRKEFLGSVCNLLCLRPAEDDNNDLVDTSLDREVLLRLNRGARSVDRFWWYRAQVNLSYAAAPW